jgi:hypothetical protein
MTTTAICEGSAMDAKRFMTSTRANLRVASRRASVSAMVAAVKGSPMRRPESSMTSASEVATLPSTWMTAIISDGDTPDGAWAVAASKARAMASPGVNPRS